MSNDTTCSPETSCGECGSAGSCDQHDQQRHMEERLQSKLALIKNRIAIMSGKGGVGKTTVSVNLALALAGLGRTVGVFDGDVHGPNVPKMLGLQGQRPVGGPNGLSPLKSKDGLQVMSLAFLIDDQDTPVAWRGPMKHGLFEQFLADVDWEPMDYLIVDLPPGTGDEPLSIAQLLGKPLWTVVVTTPQDVALLDSRKSVVFARNVDMNVLGIVENMSGLTCPHCGGQIDLFKTGGGHKSALELGVPFLGSIPIDPMVVTGSDAGVPIVAMDGEIKVKKAFQELAEQVDRAVNNKA